MTKVFLYPKPDKLYGTPNPYINNFQDAASKKFTLVNENAPNRGVLNLFLFFFKTEIFIFNWVEYLPEKKFGKIQSLGLFILIYLAKIFNKKIIWVLHNKSSHHQRKNKWTNALFNLMTTSSHRIITHSHAGLEFIKLYDPNSAGKVIVITHPIMAMFNMKPKTQKVYDFIIWGTIFPYKGIDVFLTFLKNSPNSSHYKVLVVGKCFDQEYKAKLMGLMTPNIVFYDELFDLEKIAQFSEQSKFTLFTYKSDTVISSGSLIDSIRMNSVIIGPNYAAFKDLSSYSFIKTYESFEEIFDIHNQYIPDYQQEQKERIAFCEENSWDNFINKLESIIKELQ